MGDVKLAAAGGAWVGLAFLHLVLLVASGVALAIVLACAIVQGKLPERTEAIPFGTFLAPAIWLVWVLQASEIIAP